MLRKRWLLVPATMIAVLAMGGTAFAQECFVVNRSDTGAVGASHSEKWVSFPLAGLLADAPEDDGFGMCPAQVTATVALVKEAGLPTVFATRPDKVLLEGTGADRNGRLGDGKGIDHFEATPVFGEIVDIAIGVLNNPAIHC